LLERSIDRTAMVTTTSKKLTQLLKKLKMHTKPHQYDTNYSSSSSLSFSSSELSQSSMGASSDDDSEDDATCGAKDVPAGSLPVYVGQERRRFVIPTRYLSNPIFRALLAKSEEEFGLRCDGGLRIACAPGVFEHFLWWLEGEGAAHCNC